MTLNATPLEAARLDLDLSMRDLWVRYFGLGGLLTEIELGDALLGQEQFSVLEYDIVAQALNEEHIDAGGNYPVGYADEA
jgi:hypothetical protein